MSDPILSLSTEVEPAKTFEIDGEEYELLGIEHLSPNQEAEVQGLFSRFEQVARKLALAGSDKQAELFAKQLRTRRVQLITKLTTVPDEVASKLPPSAQLQLFRAVANEFGKEDDDDGAGAE